MIARLVHSPMRYRPWMLTATRMLHDSSSKRISQPAKAGAPLGAPVGSFSRAGVVDCRRHPDRFHTTHSARRATDVTVSPLIGAFTGDGAIIYKQCPRSRVRRRVHRGEARRASPCAAGTAGGGGQHRRVQADRRHIARRRGREADSELHRPGWRIASGGSERDARHDATLRLSEYEPLPATALRIVVQLTGVRCQ